MKAVGYQKSLPIDDPASLLDIDVAEPKPRPRDLIVAVDAVSVNPVDTKVRMRSGPLEGDPYRILGWDAAGTVKAVGSEVTFFKPGDEVFYAGSIIRPGTNAQLHAVDERIVGRKPASLSLAQSAALPLTTITAYELLFDRLGVQRGKPLGAGSLLITGGAGGVGSILIQLARRLTGLTVIATASRPESVKWCLELGAHHVIDHSKPLVAQLQAIGIPSVEYIASLTGTGAHYPALIEALTPQGKIGVIDDPEALDANKLKGKSASLHWEAMFARSTYSTPDMSLQGRLLTEVGELVDAGIVRTTLNEVFGTINAANLKRAHALIESGTSRGKIVLEGF